MILCPFNGESIRKCVYGNNLLVRGEQLIKFVAILKPDDCIFDHICAPRRNTTGHPQSVCVCECVCKRLLFCSKCTGFTVRLTYNDISLSMYINQCEINLELPYLWYIVVLLPQKRFWAILSSPFTVNGELKILQNRSKKRFWGKRATKVLVWSCR